MRAGLALAAIALSGCTFEGARVGDDEVPTEREERTVLFVNNGSYAGVVDTEVDEDRPDEVRGALGEMRVDMATGNSMNAVMSLLRFDDIFGDAMGQIPDDAQVLEATLSFTVIDNGADGAVCDMVRSWEADVTWNFFSDGAAGPEAEVDFDPNPIGGLPGAAVRHEVNVLPSVQAWHLGSRANNGWVLFPLTASGIGIATSEVQNDADRPALEVRFSAPVP